MDFEVDSDELKIIEKDFSKSSEDIKGNLSYWRNQIERLKEVWTGEDADIFYIRMEEYLSKLDMLGEVSNEFSKAFKYGYSMYEEKDEAFAKSLKQENDQYDDKAFNNMKLQSINNKEGV